MPATIRVTNISASPVNVPGGPLAPAAYRDESLDLILHTEYYQTNLAALITAGSITVSYQGVNLTAAQVTDLEITIGTWAAGEVLATTAELHVYADGTLGNDANTGFQYSAGTGGSFSVTAGIVTFTGTGAAWTTDDIGRLLTINYATSPDNNGSFIITGVTAPNQVTYANSFGVTETMPAGGKWTVSSPKQTITAATALIPEEIQHNTCMHLSGFFNGGGGLVTIEKRVAASIGTVNFVIDGGTATAPISALSGSGDTLAASGGVVTLTDAGANFTSALIGKAINVGGATTAAHLGNFTITGVLSATQLTWANAGTLPASEAYTGTWTIYPFDEVRTGTGDSLTFTAGPNTVDLVDAGAAFTSADKGKQIIIAGSGAGNDGTFIITAVVSATQVTYINVGGATESPFTGTWTLGAFTADIASSSSLGLSTAGWAVDQWMGCWVEILTGAAAGQTRLVQSNTATTLTPVRNFSVSPGAGATFRFVRPKTTLSNIWVGINAVGAASSGIFASYITLQNLYMDWSLSQFQIQAANYWLFISSLMCNSRSSIPFLSHGSQTMLFTGSRVNPHTFAVESATTNSMMGASAFNRLVPGGATYSGFMLRGFCALQLNSCVMPLAMVIAPMTDLYLIRQGSRILHCPLIQCHGEGMANLISTTSGYATTKFGNHPAKANLPGIYMEGSRCGGFGAVDISGWNDHGIVMNMSSTLYINGAVSGTMGRSGLYIHSGSICQVKGGITPTLSGTALGNITVDDATLASTWAAIAAGTPMVAGSELSMVKAFTNIYGL